ncbi:MAG: hypothetical protein ACOYN0_10435 [Phycisphaerales bacterium]
MRSKPVEAEGVLRRRTLATFAAAFSAGAPLADYDNDELVTSDDALTFLTDFVNQVE